MEEASDELDVGVLVNNMGVMYSNVMFFDEVEEKVWMKMVRVNVEGTTKVTMCSAWDVGKKKWSNR
ncbi:beta-keto reductase [Vigna unguiculata]|uniref:Beta-keto reductase n=1 Tax=Vigna unguiculata TaxID=3917 RepID=A0A4D6MZG8_VIGUN|nr:beta-keto reductase [Vigna unguiculata]